MRYKIKKLRFSEVFVVLRGKNVRSREFVGVFIDNYSIFLYFPKRHQNSTIIQLIVVSLVLLILRLSILVRFIQLYNVLCFSLFS